MKVNRSVEQGVYVLCILALQKNHTSVKSTTLSSLLQVSDSYLKKLLAKMVKADLIRSAANRSGGYQLARPVQEITLYDVFSALDQDKDVLELQHLSDHIFSDRAHARESEQKIRDTFERGFQGLYAELKQFRISDLLRSEYLEDGYTDWNRANSNESKRQE